MDNKFKPDEELNRLQSMHETVERLRSKLKDIKLDTYSITKTAEEENIQALKAKDAASKKYR